MTPFSLLPPSQESVHLVEFIQVYIAEEIPKVKQVFFLALTKVAANAKV